MRGRMRLVLPLAQVAFAVALTTRDFLRPGTFERPSWTAPFRQFFLGLNAPAAQIKVYLTKLAWMWDPQYYPTMFILDTIVYVGLVGLVWYAVSIEIYGKGKSVLTPKTGMRRLADLLAVVFGAVLAVTGLQIHRRANGYLVSYPDYVGHPDLVAVLFFIWGATLLAFYGHDLWVCFGTAQKQPTAKDHAR
jgi:hypothetical protein